MVQLTAVFIVGIIVLGIYRLFELYARRKERMMMIEKLAENAKPINLDMNLPFLKANTPPSSWVLKISLLLIGIGLGSIIAFVIQYAVMGELLIKVHENWEVRNNLRGFREMIYFACIAVFGGLGLLIAYLIEVKQNKK